MRTVILLGMLALTASGFGKTLGLEVAAIRGEPAILPPGEAYAECRRAYAAGPSLAIAPNGRLWATWHAGVTPGEDKNGYIVLATSADDGETWQDVAIADPDGDGPRAMSDPQVWVDPDGRLNWSFSERMRDGKGTAELVDSRGQTCLLGMATFPDANALPKELPRARCLGPGVMMGKPSVLRDGTWLLPVARWHREQSSGVMTSRDHGGTWAWIGGATLPPKERIFDEHSVVESADGALHCFSRSYRDMFHAVSRDGGRNWTESSEPRIKQPSARFLVRKLASGRWLMVKHGGLDRRIERSHLTAWLSDDEGKTWKGGLLLDARNNVSYPDGDQRADGLIYVVYDYERTVAREVSFATFTEADVLAGKDVSGQLRLRQRICGRPAPAKVFYAKGGATAEPGGKALFRWTPGGEQPIAAWDFGGRTVSGYAVFKVKSFKAQGKDAEGNTVGWPVVRLSYATHPDGLGPKGCFTRKDCAHYLGPTFDNPVLPANVNRHETYTIARTGTFIAPLIQGQERYVRVQLDTPGTEVEIESLEIRNVGVHSTEPVAGSFRTSDARVNRTWDMSVWTCNLASFPNHDAWRVVEGKLLPRKLERGTSAGLCTKAELAGDGSWSADFELRANPHHDSALGLMLRAESPDDGVVVVVSQPACCRIYRRTGGENRLLAQMVVEDRILDGVPCTLEARVKGKEVTAYFNGGKVVSATVYDLPAAGKFGLYVEKEWWPVVSAVTVKDASGREVLREDFAGADAEGRLPGWDYTRSFKFMADGAKRDRLVWIGDLWWAARSCFYGYRPDWPYFRESLKLLAYNQNPEGYVWAAPYGEIGRRPGKGEFGHFPSDEFSAWLAPITWEYYLYTADDETMKTLYPAVAKDLAYLLSHCRADGVFEQRLETSCHACSMDPVDPRHRAYMNFVLYLACGDGAKLARALGHADDAARWEAAAAKIATGVRQAFWNPDGKFFRRNLEQPGTWEGTLAMALASGFANAEEALAIAPRITANAANKFHLLGLRGKFRYGFDEAAFNMLEGGTWFRLSDPSWEGAQCCTECGFMTRKNWWDESHPDTTAAGVITTYLLGVEPVTPGYRTFRFAPHLVSRLTFAEGRVPTPHGDIVARWERRGDALKMTLAVPEGTEATVAVRGAQGLTVNGTPSDGKVLKPGQYAIAATLGPDAMIDRSLVAASAVPAGERWFEAPTMTWPRELSSEAEFAYVIDFGTVKDVQALELLEDVEANHPNELRVDVSEDGLSWKRQAELTPFAWAGCNKPVTVDLRTVGGALQARFVRLRMKHPKAQKDGEYGDVFYRARFNRVRVQFK